MPLEECKAVPAEGQTEFAATLCMKCAGMQAPCLSRPRNCPAYAKLCEGGQRSDAGRNYWLAVDVPCAVPTRRRRRPGSGRFGLRYDQLRYVEKYRLYRRCSDIDSQEHEQDLNRKWLSEQNERHAAIPNRGRSLGIMRTGEIAALENCLGRNCERHAFLACVFARENSGKIVVHQECGPKS